MTHSVSLIQGLLEHVDKGGDLRAAPAGLPRGIASVEAHVQLLVRHGLVDLEQGAERAVRGLTREGARLLTAMRDERVRKRILEGTKKLGEEATIEVVLEIAKDAFTDLL